MTFIYVKDVITWISGLYLSDGRGIYVGERNTDEDLHRIIDIFNEVEPRKGSSHKGNKGDEHEKG